MTISPRKYYGTLNHVPVPDNITLHRCFQIHPIVTELFQTAMWGSKLSLKKSERTRKTDDLHFHSSSRTKQAFLASQLLGDKLEHSSPQITAVFHRSSSSPKRISDLPWKLYENKNEEPLFSTRYKYTESHDMRRTQWIVLRFCGQDV
jgi:hypothetical protein